MKRNIPKNQRQISNNIFFPQKERNKIIIPKISKSSSSNIIIYLNNELFFELNNIFEKNIELLNSLNVPIKNYNYNDLGIINIPDSIITLKDSLGNILKTENVLASENQNIEAPDGNIINDDESFSLSIRSGEMNKKIPNSEIFFNGIKEGDVVSVKSIFIRLYNGVDLLSPENIELDNNTLDIFLNIIKDVALVINGQEFKTYSISNDIEINIENSNSELIGTLVPNQDKVTVADTEVEINGTSFIFIKAEGVDNIGIKNSEGANIGTLDIPNKKIDVGDSNFKVLRSNDSEITNIDIPAEQNDEYKVVDSSISVKNSKGDTVDSGTVMADSSEEFLAPDGKLTVNGIIDVLSIPSNDVEELKVENTEATEIGTLNSGKWLIQDADLDFNGTKEGEVVSGKKVEVSLKDTNNNQVTPSDKTLTGNTLEIEIDREVEVTVNSNNFTTVDAPDTVNVPVKNTENTNVGTITSGEVIVGDSNIVVKNSLGDTVDSENVPATKGGELFAPDGTVVIKDSGGTTLKSKDTPSNGSVNETINDSTVNINKSDSVLIAAQTVKAEGVENYNVADSVITLNNSVPTLISTTNVKATDPATIVAPDANVINSDASYDVDIPSNTSHPLEDVDYIITDENNNELDRFTYPGMKNTTIDITTIIPKIISGTGNLRVRFWDIDGTLLKENYVNAGEDSIPPTPTPRHRSNIIEFDVWNRVSTNVQHDLDIGAVYKTKDNKTHIRIRVTPTTGLSPIIRLNKDTTDLMTVDWGDTITSTSSASGNVSFNHTYSTEGDYWITITCTGDFSVGQGGTGTTFLGGSVAQGNVAMEIYFGSHAVRCLNNGLRYLSALEYLSLPKEMQTIGTQNFGIHYSLRHLTIPDGIATFGTNMFNGVRSAKIISLPNSITNINAASIFSTCYGMDSFICPSGITTIAASAFANCSACNNYIFPQTTPPTLANINAFTGIQPTDRIFVPDANVTDYKTATNWSTYADYIYPLSQRR